MAFVPATYAAVTPVPAGNLCGEGLGPFAKFLCDLPTPPADPTGAARQNTNNAIQVIGAFAYLISNIIGIIAAVAGLIFIFQIIIGGFNWLTSSGDKARLEKAQNTLLNAIIGLTIVLASYALISLIGNILGFDILISNPGRFVDLIKPR